MSIILRKEIARFLIIAFLFFIIPSDSFPVKRDERTGLKLIKQAEKLFKNYKYQDSINKFREAEKYVKSEKNLSRFYLGISRSYYAIGLMSQVKEAINKLAMLSVKSSFKRSKYPRGYLKIYNDIQAEIEKKKKEELIVKTEEEPESLYQVEKQGEEIKEITKKPLAGVIEKPGKKKKKKKSLLLPLTLGAVALGAVVMLMGKKSDGGGDTSSNTASVHIESTPSGASVFVDGASKGVTTPCDISVKEGYQEIRLVIEGWGETSNKREYVKENSYTLNAQLAPYKYHSAFQFPVHSSIVTHGWDMDHSGNIYGVYYQNDSLNMVAYNGEGEELDSIVLLSSNAPQYFHVQFNNYTNQLYVFRHNGTAFYIFNREGELLNRYSIYLPTFISGFSTGDILINSSYDIIKRYNSNFELIEELIKTAKGFKMGGIKCSDDDQNLFVGKMPENIISKYDQSGNLVLSWSPQQGYFHRGYFVTSFGQSELEKVFIRTCNGNGSQWRLEIYTGNGEFLTATENIDYIGDIAEDNSYNIYVMTNSHIIKRFEPSSETEGTGTWEGVSSLSTTSRMGSNGTTVIDPSQQKKSNKSNIIKNKKKRIIK